MLRLALITSTLVSLLAACDLPQAGPAAEPESTSQPGPAAAAAPSPHRVDLSPGHDGTPQPAFYPEPISNLPQGG